jgi:hypothetical protein
MNNRRGLSLDEARLRAAEAGYFGYPIDRAMADTTISDLVEKLEAHPQYSDRDAEQLQRWRDQAEGAAARKSVERHLSDVEGFARENGLDIGDKELMAEAARVLADGQAQNEDDALERAAIQLYETDRERGEHGQFSPDASQSSRSAGQGGGLGRSGLSGHDAGARAPVRSPGEAWRQIADGRRDRGDDDVASASDAAGKLADPPSLGDARKSLAGLDASLKEAEESWANEQQWLDEADRKRVEDAVAAGEARELTRAESLRDLLGCLTVAEI